MTRAPWPSSFTSTGSDARIRPSSVTTGVSSLDSGTFRSQRTRTRRPATPTLIRSSTVRIRSYSRSRLSPCQQRLQAGAHVAARVAQPFGVAPLVVVPADNLHLVPDHLGEGR